jgi:hypothetical protein
MGPQPWVAHTLLTVDIRLEVGNQLEADNHCTVDDTGPCNQNGVLAFLFPFLFELPASVFRPFLGLSQGAYQRSPL